MGLSAYIDNFHQQNLVTMSQLEDYTQEVRTQSTEQAGHSVIMLLLCFVEHLG
jgi:hypothetical protein